MVCLFWSWLLQQRSHGGFKSIKRQRREAPVAAWASEPKLSFSLSRLPWLGLERLHITATEMKIRRGVWHLIRLSHNSPSVPRKSQGRAIFRAFQRPEEWQLAWWLSGSGLAEGRGKKTHRAKGATREEPSKCSRMQICHWTEGEREKPSVLGQSHAVAANHCIDLQKSLAIVKIRNKINEWNGCSKSLNMHFSSLVIYHVEESSTSNSCCVTALPKYFTFLRKLPRGERNFPGLSLLTLAGFKVNILRSYLFTSANKLEGYYIFTCTCVGWAGSDLKWEILRISNLIVSLFSLVILRCSPLLWAEHGCTLVVNSRNSLHCPLSKYRTRIFKKKKAHKLFWLLALLFLSSWHHASVTSRTWHNENKAGGRRQCDLENAGLLWVPSLSVCTTLRVYRTPATGKNRTSVEGDDKKSGLFFHYFIVNIAGGCHERGEGGKLAGDENNSQTMFQERNKGDAARQPFVDVVTIW